MCGVGGFLVVRTAATRNELEARLWRMIATLRHRGPDDEGVWTDGRAGLAHARLSIIDLSPAGHQPMASADGTAWITYNGEIYNFAEIRQELEALGYPFRSRSDTEVIINGWQAWGPKVFSRLRGMFALAIWDRRSQRLILARDRLGKKPLYYAPAAAAFLFGSEIKALLAWPGLSGAADLSAIDSYLTFGYVAAPQTAFAGIRKLPAAHYLVLEALPDGSLGEPELVRYWRLPGPRGARRHRRAADLRRELVAQLEEAVRLRLISDVPLGAFLSGGVDSSAVVATMARVGGGRVKTFSIGFSAKEYDETRYARLVAERYATDHEELLVEPDAVAVLPQLIWHYDQPFADPSAIPTYYISEIARRKVTVALNGDGGDECFLGYNRYKAMHYLSRLDAMPRWSRIGLGRSLALAPAALQRRYKIPRIRALLQAPDQRPSRRYAFTIVYFTDDDKAAGYGDAMQEHLASAALDLLEPYFAEADSLVSGANWADIHTYLPDDLMVKVDVASMAHGLEARSPLLDHVFMEWAAEIPEQLRMAHGETKSLFKSAMEPYLPNELLYRPKKGFGCPLDHWFRSELKEFAYDVLLSRSARDRNLFRSDYVRCLLDEHCTLTRDHHTRLWALLMLELWFQMWIDAPAAPKGLRPSGRAKISVPV
ncbi:MAG: asparagine synthase (glutamine-hydrolyzing) [Alphaproteobacteria bacterium]|nr:asparagine synthase (glutamine-hydrolyzing) [Alphaproteobacteria bacterium]